MSDLLKKAEDMGKYPDDDWREILGANGFFPSGTGEEVWGSPYSDIKVMIDVDRETEEPFYQVITEDGSRSAHWTDSEALKTIVEPKEQEPPTLSPEEEKRQDEDFLKSMGIVGRQRTEKKFAGRPPRFSFAVPMNAAGTVAFHLAKAGMRDFDVAHYEDDEVSMFNFPTEPEMHVAEEIVKAEYADQIRAQKGLWGMWADKGQDLSQVKPEEPKQKYVASEKPPVEITDDDLPEGFFSDKPFEQQRREQQRREKEPSWEPDYEKIPKAKSALLEPDLTGWPTWEPPKT
jgi:hypothetical protein